MFTRKFDSVETRNQWIKSNKDKFEIHSIFTAECQNEDGEVYHLPAVKAEFRVEGLDALQKHGSRWPTTLPTNPRR